MAVKKTAKKAAKKGGGGGVHPDTAPSVVIDTPQAGATVATTFDTTGTCDPSTATLKAELYQGTTLKKRGSPNPLNTTDGTWSFNFASVPAGTYTLKITMTSSSSGTTYTTETITVSS